MNPKIFEAISMLQKCTDPKSVLEQWLANDIVSRAEYVTILENL